MKPKSAKTIRPVFFFLLLAGAIAVKLSPKFIDLLSDRFEPTSLGDSKHYNLVAGSIYDGDTFRVSDGNQEIKVRLCGIDAPEKDQELGVESRDHLRDLIAHGNGHITLVATDTDRYGRTVAEAFIPTGNDEEIHLNSQMVGAGMAYVYPKYVGSCPNGSIMQVAEEDAKQKTIGVWASPTATKPWDYRQRS
jgi:micrococcal nuclease